MKIFVHLYCKVLIAIGFIFGNCVLIGSANASNISGDIRGVTFFYLDSQQHDFPYILTNQDNPLVSSKIDAILNKFAVSGVNWIRLVFAADHFSTCVYNPVVNAVVPSELVAKISLLNKLLKRTRSIPYVGKFQVSLVLIPPRTRKTATDANPCSVTVDGYGDMTLTSTADQQWFQSVLLRLDYSNIGKVLLGGDLTPCVASIHRT